MGKQQKCSCSPGTGGVGRYQNQKKNSRSVRMRIPIALRRTKERGNPWAWIVI